MRVIIPTMLAVSLTAWGAAAQQQAPAPSTMQVPPAAAGETQPLVQQQQGQVSFVSGGTSQEERATLHGMASQYNMRLMFALQPSGEYLADIGVKVVDAHGRTVLDTVADGPLFYAHVPSGHYSVTVTNGGHAQTRTLDIGERRVAAQSFYWHQEG